MSSLPPFSPAELAQRDEENEAPSHRAVGDFPIPSWQIRKQLQTKAAAGARASTSSWQTSSPTPALASSAKVAADAAAASFNSLASPSPALSFQAQLMQSNAPPDTTGAVSPNYAMSVSNDEIVIQDRSGNVLQSTNLNNFWTAAFGSAISPAWDPNVRYDPYAQRWILVDMGAYSYSNSSMLIGVSATSDPRGTWYLRRFQAASGTTFDHPRVGFNSNWIVVTGNELDDANGLNWIYSVVYVIDKADLYANGSKTPAYFTTTTDFTLTPALTYDNSVTTMYMMANYNGANGSLSLSTITGPVDSPTVAFDVAFPTTTNTWATTVPSSYNQNFAPQLGSSTDIGVFDARMNTVVYRNGSLWATHTVFLPASNPTISAVDWWQVGTDGTVQQFGRLQDPNGVFYYTYPSLAVNANGDMLLGYSRMSSGTYGSGGYAFRAAADPAGTLRQEYVMGSGQGGGENSYVHLDGNGVNRWGDYSATQVDPVNDTDFWTVQEFAGTSGNAWGMWWDNVVAPASTTPTLQSVSVNPSIVTGGQSSTGTVTLNMFTPNSLSVGLSSSNPAAQVPSSVTVAANAASADFSITTNSVPSSTSGLISATYGGITDSANITVNPPVAVQSVIVNPTAVVGGHLSTGTVTLSVAAPSGGVTVALSSGNSAVASVPSSVVVAAGASSATFNISTTSVSAATTVAISGTYSGASQSANLTVDPSGGVPLSAVQAQQNFNPNSGVSSITANISSTAGDLLVAFVREGSNSTDNFTITDNLGQHWTLAAYNSFSSVNRSGLFYIPNSQAVTSVTANFTTSGGVTRSGIVVYEIVGAAASSPVDAGPVMNSQGGSSSITSAPLTTTNANDALIVAVDVATDQSGTNNSFVPGSGFAFPTTGSATDTRQAVAYAIVASQQTSTTGSMSWATNAGSSSSQFIAFRTDPVTTAPALQSISLNPTTVTGGQSSTGTVTLTSAAPTGGLVVNLSSNSSSAQVPSSGTVTVAAGQTTATFTITTTSVSTSTTATISASYNGVTQTANLTMNPLPSLSSVTVSPSSVTGGQSATATVTLSSAAPAGGTVVNVSSNSTAAQVPASGTVTVAAGQTTATFTITTSTVSTSTTATLSASYNGVTQNASLIITPLTLQSLTLSPTTVAGGQSVSGTLTLSGPAPPNGAVVSVSSNSPAALVPAGGTVTVPSGSTSVSFPITTSKVTSATVVTISAGYNGALQTTTFTITPLSVVQAQSNFVAKNGNTSITATIATTAGDLLVAYVREGSNSTDNFTVTDNLGQHWTLAGYNSFNSNERSGIFYMPNSAAVSSVTAKYSTSGGVTRPGIVVYEISGAATTTPVDAGPADAIFNSSHTNITSAPLSSSNANDVLLFAVDLDSNQSGTNNGFAPGAGFGFPSKGPATNTRQAVSYAIVSSLQTSLTTSMSWASTARNGATQFIAFHAGP